MEVEITEQENLDSEVVEIWTSYIHAPCIMLSGVMLVLVYMRCYQSFCFECAIIGFNIRYAREHMMVEKLGTKYSMQRISSMAAQNLNSC